MKFFKEHPKFLAYAGIVFVVMVWGVIPPISNYLYNFYSASVYTAVTTFFAGLALLLLSLKSLKTIDKNLLKVAIPTGFIIAFASLSQKIGLQYTTPTRYAFLENLCCVVVPIMLFFMVRKKPSILTIISVVVCLVGSFILSGASIDGGFGVGEILCSLAGCLYGVNIAITGKNAKNLNPTLFVMIQTWIQCIVSFSTALILNFIKVDGASLESFNFTFDFLLILLLAGIGLVSNTFCWTVRTSAMKHVSPGSVAIIMPFSAVVTGVLSIMIGMDEISSNLIIGALLCFVATLLSGMDDLFDAKKQEKTTLHNMKLQNEPFEKIKNGTKTIELRLYDEKRRLLSVGDTIEFSNVDTNEKIKCKVHKLYLFDNFDALYKNLSLKKCGYTQEEISTATPKDMMKYYSEEDQNKYGVVGILIKREK